MIATAIATKSPLNIQSEIERTCAYGFVWIVYALEVSGCRLCLLMRHGIFCESWSHVIEFMVKCVAFIEKSLFTYTFEYTPYTSWVVLVETLYVCAAFLHISPLIHIAFDYGHYILMHRQVPAFFQSDTIQWQWSTQKVAQTAFKRKLQSSHWSIDWISLNFHFKIITLA